MTDARLVATNPENSSIVPVACNAAGQVLVSDVVIEQISNDLNLDGDLTVSGNGDFSNGVDIQGDLTVSNGSFSGSDLKVSGSITTSNGWSNDSSGAFLISNNPSSKAEIALKSVAGSNNVAVSVNAGNTTDPKILLKYDGSARFQGNLQVGTNSQPLFTVNAITGGMAANTTGSFAAGKITLKNDGSVDFAAGKAGFTAEGFLWCTTERGDTVYLQGTSGGVGMWAAFSPPARGDLIKEQLQEWSEKDKPDESQAR